MTNLATLLNSLQSVDEQQYKVLVVDINNVFTQQFIGNDYRRDDGTDLSGVYGTLKMLQYQIHLYAPTYVVCVFDGKGGSHKKRKIFPDYKQNRGIPVKINYTKVSQPTADAVRRSNENFVFQLKMLHEFLAFLPVHRVVAQGYEADELIGYIVQKLYPGERKLIISNDKDFHQLVSEDVHIYDPKARKIKDLTFIKEYWGTDNTHLLTVLRTILGDTSDKVGGIDGLKLKGVQKYFPDLFERSDIQTVKDFAQYLTERAAQCANEKKAFATNWQTIKKKCEHLLTGKNLDGTPCWEIIERNYDLMQLFDPEISVDTVLLIARYLEANVRFNAYGYKKKVLEEGLLIEGKSTEYWEAQYRDLEYNQKKAAREEAAA